MKSQSTLAIVTCSFLVMSAPANAGSTADEKDAMVPEVQSAFSIKGYVNARLRYEYAGTDGKDDATLGSLRTRFGVNTEYSDAAYQLKFLVEGEHNWVLTDTDRYTAFPPFPNNGRAVIADPDNLELNRLVLKYASIPLKTSVSVGRQHIKLADERFVGTVSWRQNEQTFDAVVLNNQSIEDLSITYAFINQVNRIFGDNTPVQALDRWEGDSHLVHLEYTGIENHTLRAFAYLLDFDQTAAGRMSSTDTFGVEVKGERELSSGNKLNYLLTAASQTDAGQNPMNYHEYYYRAQLGLENGGYNYGAGVEVLTSDGVSSFQHPLGTNHAFNGFADAFLTTPALGLIDYYAWVGTKALGFKHKLAVHEFTSESGSMRYGWEIDYVAVRALSENAKVVVKAAYLDGKGAQRDTTRASAEINYSF